MRLAIIDISSIITMSNVPIIQFTLARSFASTGNVNALYTRYPCVCVVEISF